MRLKQLLGLLLLFVPAAFAAAVGLQLTKITVAEQPRATTLVLEATGAFTHTEYRPTDNLLLVDLPGVSAGKLQSTIQSVKRPGVDSYRVVSYVGTGGVEVTRVEMVLSPRAGVKVAESEGRLRVIVEPALASSSASADAGAASSEAAASEDQVALSEAASAQDAPVVAAAASAMPAVPQREPAAASAPLTTVNKVSVVQKSGATSVEIVTSAPVEPVSMKLDSPDRIVVDIPNAVPAGRRRPMSVDDPVLKSIRVARYQDNPPVTRVVLDLAEAQDFQLASQGNKVVVKLAASTAAASDSGLEKSRTASAYGSVVHASLPLRDAEPVQAATPAAPASPVGPAIVPAIASPYQPVFPSAQQAAETPRQMAEKAAKVMNASSDRPSSLVVTPPVSAAPAMSMAPAQQPAMNTNMAPAQQPVVTVAQAQRPPAAAAAQTLQTPQAGQPTASVSRYTGEPISVNLKDVDLKDFFRLVHEISGLNIVLDPAVRGTLTLVLDDVPWDQALDIVLQNNSLDRHLEGNVLRIATRETFTREAEARRAQAQAQALAVDPTQYTHYLSYAHAADVVPLVKRFLTTRGEVLADPRTNALLIKDIPNVIPEVQRLLAQLDRKTQEVEIEARVVAATRNFARDIGVQLGFAWNNGSTIAAGVAAAGASPFGNPISTTGTTQGVATPGSVPLVTQTTAVPLFSNLGAVGATSGLAFSNIGGAYRVDTILTMAERRGLLKILSRPRVVTQNNISATVKQGVRVPVVTAAQLGGPPTVTYVEAALRLQVTPQVTAENTIFLSLDLENTTPDFSRQVQGNPTLVTQQTTTSVLVNDGGTVVIGGVIQTQNSVNVQQVPLLGDIPILGNLFKRRSVETSTQELIFFITPKIVQT